MHELPQRGRGVRELGLALPPEPMPRRRGTRPLKRWRYVGAYAAEAMVCAVELSIGRQTRRWWAVALPDGTVLEAMTKRRGVVLLSPGRAVVRDRDVTVDLILEESGGIECVSPEASAYAWTRKQAGVEVTGEVRVAGARIPLGGAIGVVDDSAGYHRRHTAWRWSAGVGRLVDDRPVAWNLVSGLHDGRPSERTLWIAGEPRELEPVTFDESLSKLTFDEGAGRELAFEPWGELARNQNWLLVRSRYRQPFGRFSGDLPGGLALREGHGVIEDHEVWW